MWRNSANKTYFFFKELRFYNITELGASTVSKERKDIWATNGNSTFIGPEELGGWDD